MDEYIIDLQVENVTAEIEDKLAAIRVTHKTDGGLFTSAIKKLMKD